MIDVKSAYQRLVIILFGIIAILNAILASISINAPVSPNLRQDWGDGKVIVRDSLHVTQYVQELIPVIEPATELGTGLPLWVGPFKHGIYALLFLITSPDSFQTAYQYAHTFSMFIGIVGVPVLLWVLFWRINDAQIATAVFATITFLLVLVRIVGWPGAINFIYADKWQFAIGLTMTIIALILAHRTYVAPTTRGRRQFAIITGVMLGILGLTQIHGAVFAIPGIFVGYMLAKKWDAVLITGSVGAGFAALYLIVDPMRDRLFVKSSGRFISDGALFMSAGDLIRTIFTPGVLFWFVLVGILYALYKISGQRSSKSIVLEGMIVTTGLMWIFFKFTQLADHEAVISIRYGWFFLMSMIVQQILIINREYTLVEVYEIILSQSYIKNISQGD